MLVSGRGDPPFACLFLRKSAFSQRCVETQQRLLDTPVAGSRVPELRAHGRVFSVWSAREACTGKTPREGSRPRWTERARASVLGAAAAVTPSSCRARWAGGWVSGSCCSLEWPPRGATDPGPCSLRCISCSTRPTETAGPVPECPGLLTGPSPGAMRGGRALGVQSGLRGAGPAQTGFHPEACSDTKQGRVGQCGPSQARRGHCAVQTPSLQHRDSSRCTCTMPHADCAATSCDCAGPASREPAAQGPLGTCVSFRSGPRARSGSGHGGTLSSSVK